MKYILAAMFLVLGTVASAEQVIFIKGRVLKIEEGRAVIKTVDGNDVLIAMTGLSKEDKKKVVFASGKKKDIELRLAPTAFKQ